MSKFDKNELYAKVSENLISLMEVGVAPWSRPWLIRADDDPNAVRNGVSNRPYTGFNALYLEGLSYVNGWSDPRFYTYKNALEVGGQVRTGEKSTMVVFNKRVVKKDADAENDRAFWLMRYYSVFNASQIDGLVPWVPGSDGYSFDDEYYEAAGEVASAWLDGEGIVLSHGGSSAHYVPSRDCISMPEKQDFFCVKDYYHTLFHEIIHSTGHSSRINRIKSDGFGSESYAKEELIAEFGSAFLSANTGVPLDDSQSAAYLRTWAARCREEPSLLVTSVNAAQYASRMVSEYQYADKDVVANV